MTTTCTACGAQGQAGRFCTVCGTALGAPAGYPGPDERTDATTEPEMREQTRYGAVGMLRAGAAAQQVPLAGTGRRAGAYLLDLLAVSLVGLVVAVVVGLATGLPEQYAALAEVTTPLGAEAASTELLGTLVVVYGALGLVSLLGWLGLALADGLTGRTIGGRLLGLRTVSAVDGGPIGAGRGLLRWLVLSLCGSVPLVGTVLVLVSPNFDSSGRRQGWHDKASRAVVQDVRGVPPRTFAPASATAGPPSAVHPAPVPVGGPAPAPVAAPSGPTNGPQGFAPAATASDPWGFPAGDRATGGVITGVPGSSAPSGAPTPASAAPAAPGVVDAPTVIGAPDRVAASPAPAPSAPSTPVPAAPAPVPVASVASPAPATDGLDDDLEQTRFSVSSHRGVGGTGTPPRIVVQLDTERRVHVARRTLVGRNPQQDTGAAAELVRLEDTTRSVSKTHLELLPTADGLTVSDLRSTNGSALIAPDGTVRELAPGTPATVTAGWTVQLGERRLTVLGADAGA
ncbi:RDD family protein [Isoptericola jiangsuensis]|uniref:RDD family protein n=1 Tax=Isoptericola jiangsuensis TaxID=548579 RepID=A0A2A9ETS5_9MICO|nr:RDD family protein [Isoptericola jiangsuensis]PFG42143.1 RDD family protein [Isoptericola jiangsuensis]